MWPSQFDHPHFSCLRWTAQPADVEKNAASQHLLRKAVLDLFEKALPNAKEAAFKEETIAAKVPSKVAAQATANSRAQATIKEAEKVIKPDWTGYRPRAGLRFT